MNTATEKLALIMALVASDARSEASGGSGSARSSGSRKYRVVSRGSNVDESLFGSSNSKGRKKSTGRKVLVGEVSGVFYCWRQSAHKCSKQYMKIDYMVS